MSTPRQALYDRLPQIYRIRDQENAPIGQFEAYLSVLNEVMAAVRDNIEALYQDLFIETCDDWVIPYIADLLGTSHLAGDPWTLRADVARTVRHRRRKGTLGAIESLTHSLTGWAVHTVELRERLVWNQHLNHLRPDAGGTPPLRLRSNIAAAVRGGTVTLRDPALLGFLNGPFDPMAHVVDLKPPAGALPRFNLPNLAIYLWRLKAYTVAVSQPVLQSIVSLSPADPDHAAHGVRFFLHPMGEPMALFNTHRFRADDEPPNLTHEDAVPGPITAARLSEDSAAGRPAEYVEVQTYDVAPPPMPDGSVGLTLHLPQTPFVGTDWRVRGANLCAWEAGLNPPLRAFEIVIDPERGRVVFGVMDEPTEAGPLGESLLVSATYGFSGPTGAHPVPRAASPETWQGEEIVPVTVNFHDDPNGLQSALGGLPGLDTPRIVEIHDSMTHDLDLSAVDGADDSEAGHWTLRLGRSLWIRAASGQRPVIRLARPLAFRPDDVTGPEAEPAMDMLDVRLEGLYLTRGVTFGANDALVRRGAVNRLSVDGCTLDPGGFVALDGSPDGTRQPIRDAVRLTNDYGFTDNAEETAFDQTPKVEIRRSISGPLMMDDGYELVLSDSMVDAGSGVGDAAPAYAVGAASGDPDIQWGPGLTVKGVTAFGRMRVERATGEGGIWVHRLEVHDNQVGCIKFSYFSGVSDRLPPHHGCVFGTEAFLGFVSEIFGRAAQGQLRLTSDRRILEQGPVRDAMGAFGYLLNTHRWKNINIRYREFMPVGVRPILIPVT